MTKTNTALIGPKKTGLAPQPPGGAPDGDAALSNKNQAVIADAVAKPETPMAASFTKRTLSTKEIAAELGVSRKKVTAWVRCGSLRVIPNCKPYRVPVAELARIEKGVLQ